MFDWTALSADPNHGPSLVGWSDYYSSISKLVFLPELGKNKTHHDFVRDLLNVNGRVLDIGIAEHTLEYVTKSSWFHLKLRELEPANEIWGLDINHELIEYVRGHYGWDRLMTYDATGEPFKREYFDAIHAGDVIEHVDNLGGFISFCRDSLKPGGQLVISTPNPHAYEFIKRVWHHDSVPANLEHTCWITPPSMNELCRRFGLEFEASYYLCGKQKTRRARYLGKRFYFKFRDFLWYEFLWVLRKPLAKADSGAA